jgi:hypothetical protein
MTTEEGKRFIAPFNGPVEIGLRALAVLNDAYPDAYARETGNTLTGTVIEALDILLRQWKNQDD